MFSTEGVPVFFVSQVEGTASDESIGFLFEGRVHMKAV